MSYIGRGTDKISNVEKLDNISFSGSTATFNLTKGGTAFIPSSAECIRLAIDGIEQGNNYTVSGSQITFDFTPSGSSTNNWIYHIGVGVITTPADGSVTLDKLSATGTKSSSTFLRGDNTFATAGGDLSFGGDTFGADKVIGSNDNYSLGIETNGSERIRFRNDGKIRIGGEYNNSTKGTVLISSGDSGASVDSTSDELVIENNGYAGITILSSTSTEGGIKFGDSGDSDAGRIVYDHNADNMFFMTSGNEALKLTDNGYLVSAPTAGLSSGQSPNVYINNSGTFKKSTSALKYKKDVRDLESIDISSFRPVRYKSNIAEDETNEDFIGFIADDFHDAGLTELVSYGEPDENGNPVVEGFNYDRVTAVLTKALQDANKKIEALEIRVQALEENNGSN